MAQKRKPQKRARPQKHQGSASPSNAAQIEHTADPFNSMLKECNVLFSKVKKATGIQIESTTLRELIKTFVKNYFRALRPVLVSEAIETSELDHIMQQLLAFANSRTSISIYKKSFTDICGYLVKIEGTREIANSARLSQGLVMQQRGTHGRDVDIIATLERVVPTAAISYRQAVQDLQQQKVSYRGTAAELREVLREVLNYLAPDAEVKATQGYRQEEGAKGPTMRQKVRYVLKNRNKSATAIEAPEEAASVVDEGIAKLVRATYKRGSLGTHTEGEGQLEVAYIKMYLDTVLCELLEIH